MFHYPFDSFNNITNFTTVHGTDRGERDTHTHTHACTHTHTHTHMHTHTHTHTEYFTARKGLRDTSTSK